MGSYLAGFFRALSYEVLISDQNTALTNTALAQKADVVVVSVHMDRTVPVIEDIAPHMKSDALLMDVTSIKGPPVKAMLKASCEVIGTHPLFAPGNGMKNQVFVVCPVRSDKWYRWLKKILKHGGAILQELSPKRHDELMTIVQGLTHFSDITLAHALKDIGIPIAELMKYQSPSYRVKLDMMGRILAQDPNLYGNIQIQNEGNVKTANVLLRASEKLLKIIKKKDLKAFSRYFVSAGNYLGSFKKEALDESNRFIEMLNREKKLVHVFKNPKDADLALLGPPLSYSDLAAKRYKKQALMYYCHTFEEIFDCVEKRRVPLGILPIENDITGPVEGILELLYASKNVVIIDEFYLPVKHCLLALKSTPLSKIQLLLSHDQAIKQCNSFLNKHLKGASVVRVPSTSAAVDQLVKENLKNTAVIANEALAKKYNLKVLQKSISDVRENRTRFIAIAYKHSPPPDLNSKNKWKTSIAFRLKENIPGVLAKALLPFAKASINMTRLESRPSPHLRGRYVFFVDFEGHHKDGKIQRALKGLSNLTEDLKVFGSY